MSDPPGVRFELDPEIERTFRIRRREQRKNQMENVPRLPQGPEDPTDPQNRLLQQNPSLEQNGQQNNQAENPHHGLPQCVQMETFYNGLNAVTQGMVDALAGGADSE